LVYVLKKKVEIVIREQWRRLSIDDRPDYEEKITMDPRGWARLGKTSFLEGLTELLRQFELKGNPNFTAKLLTVRPTEGTTIQMVLYLMGEAAFYEANK
jgi:hypothetical protein